MSISPVTTMQMMLAAQVPGAGEEDDEKSTRPKSPKATIMIPPLDPKKVDKYFLDIPSLMVEYKDKPDLFYEHVCNGSMMNLGLLGWQAKGMNRFIFENFNLLTDRGGISDRSASKYSQEAKELGQKSIVMYKALKQHMEEMEKRGEDDPFRKEYEKRKELFKFMTETYLPEYVDYLKALRQELKSPIEPPARIDLKKLLGEKDYEKLRDHLGYDHHFESRWRERADFIKFARNAWEDVDDAFIKYEKDYADFDVRREKLMRIIFSNAKEESFMSKLYVDVRDRDGASISRWLNWTNPVGGAWDKELPEGYQNRLPTIASHGAMAYRVLPNGLIGAVLNDKPLGLLSPFNGKKNGDASIYPIYTEDDRLQAMSVDEVIDRFKEGVSDRLSENGSGPLIVKMVDVLGKVAKDPKYKLGETEQAAMKKAVRALSHLLYEQKSVYDAKGRRYSRLYGTQDEMDDFTSTREKGVRRYWKEFNENLDIVRKAVPAMDKALNTNPSYLTIMAALAPQDEKLGFVDKMLALKDFESNFKNKDSFWESYYAIISAFPLNAYFPEDREIMQKLMLKLQKLRLKFEDGAEYEAPKIELGARTQPARDAVAAGPRVITGGDIYVLRSAPKSKRPEPDFFMLTPQAYAAV